MNRVLSWPELKNRNDGAVVYLEHRTRSDWDGVYRVAENQRILEHRDRQGGWYIGHEAKQEYGKVFRAWDMPQMPTNEERKMNPWGGENDMNNEAQYIKISDIAKTLNVSRPSATELVYREMPHVRIGRSVRIRREDFERWQKEREQIDTARNVQRKWKII